jgi:nicotinate-nucleotide pyrophosphorylase (carboxylating)
LEPDTREIALRADAARLAELALAEDGPRDISSLVSVLPDQPGLARIEARQQLVVAGLGYADAVIDACGLPPVRWHAAQGSIVAADTVLGEISGNLRAILRAERPLLNLLQRACGIATVTGSYVAAISGTACRVLHTRKTTPGLRRFEIAAVIAGGGWLHRPDLADDVMIKDNHWQALLQQGSTLRRALVEARALGATTLQVEVETLQQLDDACAAGATRLLIDNQTPSTVAIWVRHARNLSGGVEIEATGGITLQNVRAYADAGVDFVSVGALTHSVPSADLGLEVVGRSI